MPLECQYNAISTLILPNAIQFHTVTNPCCYKKKHDVKKGSYFEYQAGGKEEEKKKKEREKKEGKEGKKRREL